MNLSVLVGVTISSVNYDFILRSKSNECAAQLCLVSEKDLIADVLCKFKRIRKSSHFHCQLRSHSLTQKVRRVAVLDMSDNDLVADGLREFEQNRRGRRFWCQLQFHSQKPKL